MRGKITYWIYNFLSYLLLPIALPYFVFNLIFHRDEWKQRLGQFSIDNFSIGRPIWIHAASMGEVIGIAPVIEKIHEKYPDIPIVLSTMTTTGNQKAKQLFSDIAERIFIIPLDFNFAVKNVFRSINPLLIVIAETEIWPNFLRAANISHCPVVIVNGRISDKSFPRYKKIVFFLQPIIDQIALFCAQSDLDSQRIVDLGLPDDKVAICGNCKFDFPLPTIEKQELREKFKINPDDLVWIAGSTRPGEEEIILQSFSKVKSKFKNMKLILTPRHLKRLAEVTDLIEKNNFSFSLRSELQKELLNDVLLLDTMGELSEIYGAADVAFVGGTLMPFGGHNPLEPAMYGIPVLFGEYINNARDSFSGLRKTGGGIQIANSNGLIEEMTKILSDSEARLRIGQRAKEVILANNGASEAILRKLSIFLKKQSM